MNRTRKTVCEKCIALSEVIEEKRKATEAAKWVKEFIRKEKKKGRK
jgi:hypothetical protein